MGRRPISIATAARRLYAVPVGIATILVLDWYFLPLRALDPPPVLVLWGLVVTSLAAAGAARAGRRATAAAEARGLLESQAALRRVATLVAGGVPPSEVFECVAEVVGRFRAIEGARMVRYDADGGATVIAAWPTSDAELSTGTRLTLDGESLTATVLRTGRPARMDGYTNLPGSIAAVLGEARVRSAVGAPIVVAGRLWGLMTAASRQSEPIPAGTESRIAEFTELVAMAISNAEARTQLEQGAAEQAALRRVATLVARGTPPGAVFAAVAEEIARILDVESAGVVRYEADATATLVASWGDAPLPPVDSNWALEGESVTSRVFRTQRPARMEDYSHADGPIAAEARRLGPRAVVGAPIGISGRVWGAALAFAGAGPLSSDAEGRIANFAELIGIAISNAETRSELSASRARVVAAADATRRQLERDLHDGIQQRLVGLALKARTAAMTTRPCGKLRNELGLVAEGLGAALDELREISRGIHPAILSEGGLGPALRTLARRAAVPVALDLHLPDTRLEERLEVAVYYVASEALTNASKHAEASVVELHASCRDGNLALAIRDDGVGGADPGRGSGLIGLTDRVEALGGTISILSPPGEGTAVHVQLQVE
jgi:signal transduction histidine kinase